MEAARYGTAPPPDLILAWHCGDARLPDAGGVLDQDAALWNRIQILQNFYRLASKIIGLTGDKIHGLRPSELVAWRYLIDEGIW